MDDAQEISDSEEDRRFKRPRSIDLVANLRAIVILGRDCTVYSWNGQHVADPCGSSAFPVEAHGYQEHTCAASSDWGTNQLFQLSTSWQHSIVFEPDFVVHSKPFRMHQNVGVNFSLRMQPTGASGFLTDVRTCRQTVADSCIAVSSQSISLHPPRPHQSMLMSELNCCLEAMKRVTCNILLFLTRFCLIRTISHGNYRC